MMHFILSLYFFNSDKLSKSSVAEHMTDVLSASFPDPNKMQSSKVVFSSSQERGRNSSGKKEREMFYLFTGIVYFF